MLKPFRGREAPFYLGDERMRRGIVACVFLTILMTVPVTLVSALPIMTSETEIRGNTISVTYVTSSPVTIDPSTPDYDVSDGSVTWGGNVYETIEISNSENADNGIADPNGEVHVILDLNDSRPFCFDIHHTAGTSTPSNLVVKVTIDGVERTYGSAGYISMGSNNAHRFLGETLNSRYFSINELIRDDDWIVADGTITVEITDRNGSVPSSTTFCILFKP